MPEQPPTNLTMVLGPDLLSTEVAVIERLIAPGVRYFGPPAVPATVWASGDADWLAQVLVEELRMPAPEARTRVDDLWALASVNTVLVDLPRVSSESRANDALIHELVHLRQFDLRPEAAHGLEPSWMVEGNATFFGNILVYTSGLPWGAEPRSYAVHAQAFANRSLAELEEDGSDDAVYRVGALATEYLVLRFGEEKVFDYWRSFSGDDWKSTFEQTFGIPVDRFYRDFDRYRAS